LWRDARAVSQGCGLVIKVALQEEGIGGGSRQQRTNKVSCDCQQLLQLIINQDETWLITTPVIKAEGNSVGSWLCPQAEGDVCGCLWDVKVLAKRGTEHNWQLWALCDPGATTGLNGASAVDAKRCTPMSLDK